MWNFCSCSHTPYIKYTTHITVVLVHIARDSRTIYNNFSGHIFSKHICIVTRLILLSYARFSVFVAFFHPARTDAAVQMHFHKSGRIFVSRATYTHILRSFSRASSPFIFFSETIVNTHRTFDSIQINRNLGSKNEIYEIFFCYCTIQFLFEIVCTKSQEKFMVCVCCAL